MQRNPSAVSILASTLAAVLLLSSPLVAALSIHPAPPVLRVDGATRGGDVILFGRSIHYSGGIPVMARIAAVKEDSDRDGSVAFDVEDRSSIWVAIDFESGETVVAASRDVPLDVRHLAATKWKNGADAVDLPLSRLDFLLLRPKKGAWAVDIWQGGRRDGDGKSDGMLRFRTADAETLHGKDSPPPHAGKKDVLVIIDPSTLDVWATAAD